jgi:hypothetical protein
VYAAVGRVLVALDLLKARALVHRNGTAVERRYRKDEARRTGVSSANLSPASMNAWPKPMPVSAGRSPSPTSASGRRVEREEAGEATVGVVSREIVSTPLRRIEQLGQISRVPVCVIEGVRRRIPPRRDDVRIARSHRPDAE